MVVKSFPFWDKKNPARYSRVLVVPELLVSGTQCISLYLTDLFIAKTPIAWTRGPSVLHVLFTDRSSFHPICRSWIFSCVSVTIVYETVPANPRDFRIKLVIHKYNSEFPRIIRQFATCSTSDKRKRTYVHHRKLSYPSENEFEGESKFSLEWVSGLVGCLWENWITVILVLVFFSRNGQGSLSKENSTTNGL